MLFCVYIKRKNGKSIAISYDCRNKSKEFAELVACICASNNIKAYLVKCMMPTPFLSYLVRYYNTDMGVMITASHNPKEYNGYKAYDEEGCQLLEAPSLEIMNISKQLDFFDLESYNMQEFIDTEKIIYTDDVVLNAYKTEVTKLLKHKIENVKVVYSALNGTGIKTLPDVLESCGAEIILNEIQCKEDKNFTTCPSPNPEKTELYSTSLPIAKQHKADIIILTDPDADRIGIEVLHNGEYIHLTGNEIGIVLTDYIMKTRYVKNGLVIKSIVSTNLVKKIAEAHGCICKDVFTGFKYDGEIITQLQKQGREHEFMFAFEESYGYLIGTHVRDKDATVTAMVIAEMVSEYKKAHKTVVDRLNELYAEFGTFEHSVHYYKMFGETGAKKMSKILNEFRTSPAQKIGLLKVEKITDYLNGIDDLPKSNVLSFDLEDGAQVIVRPSGTEPLIKVYVTLSQTKEKNEENLKEILKYLDNIMK